MVWWKLLRKSWRRGQALTLTDLWLLGKLATLLLAIRLGLVLLPFQTVRRILAQAATLPAPGQPPQPQQLARIVWAATVMGRYLLGNKPCLPQALAVQLLYRRQGCPAALQIGVAKDASGRLLAHAWVESGGQIVIGGAHSPQHFTPLPSLEQIPL